MHPISDPEQFVGEVEKFSGRSFRYRREIVEIVRASASRDFTPAFDELIFYAKFLSRAQSVLRRLGSDAEDTAKLSAEFEETVVKTTALLRLFFPDPDSRGGGGTAAPCLAPTMEGLGHLLGLAEELACIKNYELDHREHR